MIQICLLPSSITKISSQTYSYLCPNEQWVKCGAWRRSVPKIQDNPKLHLSNFFTRHQIITMHYKISISVLQRISSIILCINSHIKVTHKFLMFKCTELSHDHILTLYRELQTRWSSKLNVFEKYIVLKLYLQLAFSDYAPLPVNMNDEGCYAGNMDVLFEFRWLKWALEYEIRASAPREPCILIEINDTLDIFADSS